MWEGLIALPSGYAWLSLSLANQAAAGAAARSLTPAQRKEALPTPPVRALLLLSSPPRRCLLAPPEHACLPPYIFTSEPHRTAPQDDAVATLLVGANDRAVWVSGGAGGGSGGAGGVRSVATRWGSNP